MNHAYAKASTSSHLTADKSEKKNADGAGSVSENDLNLFMFADADYRGEFKCVFELTPIDFRKFEQTIDKDDDTANNKQESDPLVRNLEEFFQSVRKRSDTGLFRWNLDIHPPVFAHHDSTQDTLSGTTLVTTVKLANNAQSAASSVNRINDIPKLTKSHRNAVHCSGGLFCFVDW